MADASEGTTAPPPPPAEAGLRDRLIDLAMEQVAARGWRDLTLADLAQASGTGLAALYGLFPSKQAILVAFLRRIDQAMLGAGGRPEEGSARDRLFEVVMRRLDALLPYKAAIRRLVADLPADPLTAIVLATGLRRSAAWMLEAAGIDQSGLFGIVRIKGLAALYLATLRVWLGDESEDLGQTMAALDRHLRQAELILNSLPGLRRASRPAAG